MDTELYEPTNQNSIKVSKVIKPTNKKRLVKKTAQCPLPSVLTCLNFFRRAPPSNKVTNRFEQEDENETPASNVHGNLYLRAKAMDDKLIYNQK